MGEAKKTIPEQIRACTHPLSVKELAPIIGISGSSLYDHVAKKTIPYRRVGGSIRFDPVVVAAWYEKENP